MAAEITVHSALYDLDEGGLPSDEGEISITTHPCIIRRDGNAVHLSYTEDGEGGRVVCHLCAWEDGAVTVSRRGAVESNLTVKEDLEYRDVYRIPPYSFDISITGRRVSIEDAGREITVRMEYEMNLGGQRRLCKMRIRAVSK